MLEHETGNHPECPARVERTLAVIRDRLAHKIEWVETAAAPEECVERVHSGDYLRALRDACRRGGGYVTADTPFGPRSYVAALGAAGAALEAARLASGADRRPAFAVGRPPGHHAVRAHGMGFCLVNSVAVAARAALDRGWARRVFILDFDVHHGNGTQEIFWEDPDVFFCSLHQYPAYPGTGAVSETGAGPGRGLTANVPLPLRTGPRGYEAAFRRIALPLIHRFAPDLVLVSAGYDAHWSNYRYVSGIQMGATLAAFHDWTRWLREAAREANAGLALVLEGGYDLEALGLSVLSSLEALRNGPASDPLGEPPWPESDPSEVLDAACRVHQIP